MEEYNDKDMKEYDSMQISLMRIADALENIQQSLEILELLSDCVYSNTLGVSKLNICGNITSHEV